MAFRIQKPGPAYDVSIKFIENVPIISWKLPEKQKMSAQFITAEIIDICEDNWSNCFKLKLSAKKRVALLDALDYGSYKIRIRIHGATGISSPSEETVLVYYENEKKGKDSIKTHDDEAMEEKASKEIQNQEAVCAESDVHQKTLIQRSTTGLKKLKTELEDVKSKNRELIKRNLKLERMYATSTELMRKKEAEEEYNKNFLRQQIKKLKTELEEEKKKYRKLQKVVSAKLEETSKEERSKEERLPESEFREHALCSRCKKRCELYQKQVQALEDQLREIGV